MIKQYLKLARLHQPTGFLLLFWPCSFGVALAGGRHHFGLLALFLLNSIIMRAAGCIVNDIIDKDLDRRIARTKTRPLAARTISIRSAILLLAILASLGAIFLFSLTKTAIQIGMLSVVLIVVYPFMKRFIAYPQAVLAMTFSIGALIGYASITDNISSGAIILYVACCFWTLGYDTIYGYQDYKDDQKLGIKSTSLTFLRTRKAFLYFCYGVMVILLVGLGILSKYGLFFYLMILAASICLIWQICSLDHNSPANCLQRFKVNGYLGLVVFLALLLR